MPNPAALFSNFDNEEGLKKNKRGLEKKCKCQSELGLVSARGEEGVGEGRSHPPLLWIWRDFASYSPKL